MDKLRKCSGCGDDYDDYGQRSSLCKSCRRKYDREYHAKRSPEKKLRKQRLQKDREVKNLRAIRKIKADAGCMDCGENDPIVLEFDHRNRSEKEFTIGSMTQSGLGLSKILPEIDKCDVVCANCHKRRTAKQMKWRV